VGQAARTSTGQSESDPWCFTSP